MAGGGNSGAGLLGLLLLGVLPLLAAGEDPYRFFTWTVTSGDIYPLGVKQKGILINNQFPGPQIDAVTNDNLVINVYNKLTEPFLLSWSGLQQRRNSFEDGVAGTTCPIPPGANFTYILQAKDQIGTYYYFPSLAFHKAAGGFGGIRVLTRPRIPVPFPPPAADYTVLIGDWYKGNHDGLKNVLDSGKALGLPDGLLINGRSWNGYTLTVQPGSTYRFRITNVGLATSLNIRFQGHNMKLVEVEGSHTMQSTYSSLDVHLGQSYSVLVTADQPGYDYAIVVSTRFTTRIFSTTAVQIDWSLNQARSIRWNLTASGPRPNPQGSYHYGLVPVKRTIVLANSAAVINGKQRYAVNRVSYVNPDTPLKLADYYKIPGVFNVGTISDNPSSGGAYLQTSVMGANYRDYVEIVFQNDENEYGRREMVSGQQAGLQLEGWRITVHSSGLPVCVDRDLHAPGQRRHVERPVGELGEAVLGAAVLPPRLDAVHVVARRVPHPQERAPLWPRRRSPDQAAVTCHGGPQLVMTG